MAKEKPQQEHQRSLMGRIGGAMLFAAGLAVYGVENALGWFNREGLSMWREAVNDVRQTFNELMWGKPEHAQGQAVPLNPTGIMVTQDAGRSSYVRDVPDGLGRMSMAQFAQQALERGKEQGNVHGQERGQDRGGMEM